MSPFGPTSIDTGTLNWPAPVPSVPNCRPGWIIAAETPGNARTIVPVRIAANPRARRPPCLICRPYTGRSAARLLTLDLPGIRCRGRIRIAGGVGRPHLEGVLALLRLALERARAWREALAVERAGEGCRLIGREGEPERRLLL